nr:hypothetical protein [Mucilaginibacter sp. L294]
MAQKPAINYGKVDSIDHSFVYKTLHNKYDEIIAYTTEGYWQSDKINYLLLASKNGEYFKGVLYLKRTKGNKWSEPVVKLKKAKKGKAIIEQLNTSGLWRLSPDSLNDQNKKNSDGSIETLTLHDGTNFRFELISADKFLAIETYQPEYFLEEMPYSTQRRVFIKIRDRFLKDYKAL